MSDQARVTVGCSTPGLYGLSCVLGIVFVTLRLCGVIAWPWLWVTAPFWGPPAALLACAGLAAAGFLSLACVCVAAVLGAAACGAAARRLAPVSGPAPGPPDARPDDPRGSP